MSAWPQSQQIATAVAVVGAECRFAGARDIGQFWDNLVNGRDGVAISREHSATRGTPSQGGYGYLADIALFDAAFFKISPKDAELMDPQQRVMLECCWHAVEDANLASCISQRRCGVFIGANSGTYAHDARAAGATETDWLKSEILSDKDFIATQISYRLNLTGPSYAVNSACSSSLLAVHEAVKSILLGECDLAIAGGVAISTRPSSYAYTEGGIVSLDGCCRPFSRHANGTVFSDGAGAVILQPLETALKEGRRIYAVIVGSATNNDGARKVGYTAPSEEGQLEVITVARSVAGVKASEFCYLEAHGSATPMGDRIELNALSRASGVVDKKPATARVGSVKGNVGHANRAAGICGFIKAICISRHKLIPPTLHVDAEDDKQAAAFGFRLNSTPVTPCFETHPFIGISSFGVGGTNVHVIVTTPEIYEAYLPAATNPADPLVRFPLHPFERKYYWLGTMNGKNSDSVPRPDSVRQPTHASLGKLPAALRARKNESDILDAVRTVLGTSEISPDDRLFDKGLDSLGAVELSEILRKKLGFEVSVEDVVAAGSVKQLVKFVQKSERAD